MDLLKKYHIKAKRSLGQNFLVDEKVVAQIIQAADLKPNDVVLEIGPGLGVLTKEIAERAKKVIAIEKDNKLCAILKQELKDYKNIEVINADILKYIILNTRYKILANLPFNIASPVIRKFLDPPVGGPPADGMILMVQKEVAQRIAAKPPNMSILSVAVQLYAKPEILFSIPKESFLPQPKVDAAMLKIDSIKSPTINTGLFFKIVKAGFSNPRKQLINNLSNGLKEPRPEISEWLKNNNINPTQRAETLTIQDWIRLTRSFY